MTVSGFLARGKIDNVVDTVFLFDPGLVKLVYRVGGLESSTEHGRRTKLGQELC